MIVPLAVARSFQRNAQAVLGSLSPAQDGSTDAAPIVVQPGGGGAAASEMAIVTELRTGTRRSLMVRLMGPPPGRAATGDAFEVQVFSYNWAGTTWANHDPPIAVNSEVPIFRAATNGEWWLGFEIVGTETCT